MKTLIQCIIHYNERWCELKLYNLLFYIIFTLFNKLLQIFFVLVLLTKLLLFLNKYMEIVVVSTLTEIDFANDRCASLFLCHFTIFCQVINLSTKSAASTIWIHALLILRALPC